MKYWPTESGEYAVHVMCDEEDIEDSPFMAYIVPDDKDNNPNQVHGIYIIYGRKDATFITLMCPRIFCDVFFNYN